MLAIRGCKGSLIASKLAPTGERGCRRSEVVASTREPVQWDRSFPHAFRRSQLAGDPGLQEVIDRQQAGSYRGTGVAADLTMSPRRGRLFNGIDHSRMLFVGASLLAIRGCKGSLIASKLAPCKDAACRNRKAAASMVEAAASGFGMARLLSRGRLSRLRSTRGIGRVRR